MTVSKVVNFRQRFLKVVESDDLVLRVTELGVINVFCKDTHVVYSLADFVE